MGWTWPELTRSDHGGNPLGEDWGWVAKRGCVNFNNLEQNTPTTVTFNCRTLQGLSIHAWLVVSTSLKKYEFVSWDNYSQYTVIYINIWQKNCSKPPTRCFCMFLAGFLLIISSTTGNPPVNLKTHGDPEHVHSFESLGDTACAFSDIFAPFGFVGHWGPWNYQRILVNPHNFPLWNSSMISNWANSMPFSPYLSLKTPSCGLLLGCSEGVSTSLQPSAKLYIHRTVL